ncbi:MAG: family 10 glycosylhydrolase [Lentisphaeria bacterium]
MAYRIILILIGCCMGFCCGQDVGILTGKQRSGSVEQKELNLASQRISDILDFLEIPFLRWDDDQVSVEQLQEVKILFLPQNPRLPEATAEALKGFVAQGGKIGVFYNEDPQVLQLLGIPRTRYVGRAELGEVSGIQFSRDAWPAIPEWMRQRSGNLLEPVLPNNAGKTLSTGRFIRPNGTDSGRIGLLCHANGFYLSHVFLAQDRPQGARFFLSFIGQYLPSCWEKAARKKIGEVGKIFGFSGLSELQAWCHQLQRENKAKFADTEKLLEQARLALQLQQFDQAFQTADQALQMSRSLFLEAAPPRNGELRGVWIHSPYGIADWGWDKTIQVLSENGFNAIFVNFLWGYVADYPSEILPNHPSILTDQGKIDRLQQCLEACQKYQVELHVWKVNWNMGHRTPEDLRRKMRILGRTQVTFNDQDTDYLSPHHPENFALERDSMLEIVRKYPVAGIHFDYIRYPNNGSDFSFDARLAFEKDLGRPVQNWPSDCRSPGVDYLAYAEWRRNNITRLVREVSHEAKKIRPGIKVSAAVYGDWESARLSIAQDAEAWIDEGLLDFICPMNYTASAEEFTFLLTKQLSRVHNRIPIYPGIGIHLLPDSAAVAEQIMLSRKTGADGFVCFQHTADFALNILPQLGQGVSSQVVTEPLPHHGNSLNIKMRGSQLGLPSGCYSLSESLLAELVLPEFLQTSSPQLTLLRDGWDAAPRAKISLQREQQTLTCRLAIEQAGSYRLELRGENALGHPFLSRGEVFRVLGHEEEKEMLLREALPEFTNKGGLKVAVWQYHSYGGKVILDFLRTQPGLDAVALYNIYPATLKACQVVIIPQPKEKAECFRKIETGEKLNQFIQAGGGLLLTHAMVGSRGFVNSVPELVETVLEQPLAGVKWKCCAEHPVLAGLGDSIFASAYPFQVSMQPSKLAQTLACSMDMNPVVVAGSLDKGRYIGCGLALGIAPGEIDAPLSEVEQKLLLNMVLWLGQQSK